MKQYKIRKLTTNNKSGDAYGVTLPRDKIEDFYNKEILFNIEISKSGIYLQSGCYLEENKEITLRL